MKMYTKGLGIFGDVEAEHPDLTFLPHPACLQNVWSCLIISSPSSQLQEGSEEVRASTSGSVETINYTTRTEGPDCDHVCGSYSCLCFIPHALPLIVPMVFTPSGWWEVPSLPRLPPLLHPQNAALRYTAPPVNPSEPLRTVNSRLAGLEVASNFSCIKLAAKRRCIFWQHCWAIESSFCNQELVYYDDVVLADCDLGFILVEVYQRAFLAGPLVFEDLSHSAMLFFPRKWISWSRLKAALGKSRFFLPNPLDFGNDPKRVLLLDRLLFQVDDPWHCHFHLQNDQVPVEVRALGTERSR